MSRHKSKAIPGRNLRLADQIQKDLAGIIQREIDTTRAGLITLSGVELSTDYAHAKVYFTVLGAEPEAATALLNEKAGWLHSQLPSCCTFILSPLCASSTTSRLPVALKCRSSSTARTGPAPFGRA